MLSLINFSLSFSSSGGFYTLKDSGTLRPGNNRRHLSSFHPLDRFAMASSAPSGTVLMYPNPNRELDATKVNINGAVGTTTSATAAQQQVAIVAAPPPDSLRQRAVAKLRNLQNFHLNWDLHMTHCKPCG